MESSYVSLGQLIEQQKALIGRLQTEVDGHSNIASIHVAVETLELLEKIKNLKELKKEEGVTLSQARSEYIRQLYERDYVSKYIRAEGHRIKQS
jgi:hypothetical protein